ncbi:MAG: ABC transporter permease [Lautropia mirabilis]|nr:ABC transporter permease [Lautropia mirabilis]
MATPVLIELREVRKRFGGHDGVPEVEILHGINLRIQAGEYVAIVGASGSGKTTLMNILGCLDRPSSGEYLFQGEAVSGLDDDALAALRREVFGFVFQGYHLIGTSSALDNVAMPARYAGVGEQARHERAAALLSRLGLEERLQYLPHQLSGGQQQRVSIARALVNGGRVILADEPTGALDSTSGEQVMQQLDELAAAGHTVILITHDPAVAARARRIISMADGRIVGDMTAPVDGRARPLPATGRAVADDSLPVRHADAPVRHANAPVRKDGRPCAEAPAEAPADLPNLPPLRGRGGKPAPAGYLAQDLPALRGRGRLPLLADLPEILRSAWRVMRLNRLRTGLTLLGIIIGVASVIVMLAVGQGSQEKVLAEMQTFGLRTIYIFREWLSDAQQARPLSMADVAAVQQVPNVEQASPVIDQNGIIVRHGNRTLRTNLSATTRHFAQALNWPVSQGTLLETEDEHDLRKVVLLGERVREALFSVHGQAVGQEILVGNVPFRVIGVMAPKPAPFPEDDVNNQVIVPVGAAAVRLVGSMELSRINVVIRDMRHAAETEAAIVKTLTARHGRKDFNILNQAQAVQQLAQANRTLTLMLGLIAAISLLVGGIGVMNVMLMTVRERTREIGIRIATGARQADILRQFLVEAMLLTGIGGTVGVSGGLLIGLGLKALGIPMAFSPLAAAMAFGCAVATGMIFGFMPARQAARLDPVRALAGE